MHVFDFDGNKSFELSELIIMISSFFRGYASLTKSSPLNREDVEKIAKLIYRDTFKEKEDRLELQEFINWIRIHPQAKAIFEINQPIMLIPPQLKTKRCISEVVPITPPSRTPDLTPKRLRGFQKISYQDKFEISPPKRIIVKSVRPLLKSPISRNMLLVNPSIVSYENPIIFTKEFVMDLYKIYSTVDISKKDNILIHDFINELKKSKFRDIIYKLETYKRRSNAVKIDFKSLLKIICDTAGICQLEIILS